MRTATLLAVLPLVLFASAPTAAQPEGPNDTGLFGFVLGKPPGIAECPSREASSAMLPRTYEWGTQARTCFERDSRRIGSNEPLATEEVDIRWTFDAQPELAKQVTLGLIGGVVHEVRVKTRGIAHQDTDAEALMEKFGKPDRAKVETLRTRMGAEFSAIHASWSRPGGASVRYYAALNRIDEGVIVASTPQGDEHRRQEYEERTRKRQAL